MLNGYAPIGHDGRKVVLHHRDQSPTGYLDEYSNTLHSEQHKLLHDKDYSLIDRDLFAEQRARYWVHRALEHLSYCEKIIKEDKDKKEKDSALKPEDIKETKE